MSALVVRISRGQFAAHHYDAVRQLIEDSAETLQPAIRALRGLVYYHVAVDRTTNSVVNVSVWTDLDAAKQMGALTAMLAQRPILEQAGVVFDPIANYEALWTIDPQGLATAVGR